ncbi:YadA-like family protein [Dyella sp. LX-66]|uniref:YadA family autotransporter adhesin n=1 Tax=unclassified Dyella TaxID=2634549 RepID=UPI001BDFA3E1|nr:MULTISPECIES: YadA-like family protein [unclassified Dyella]MBT2118709.1 YadA-like family protein [Dyella sp. LX-1]MBT2141058.1 YadA-like family protein [Dyella sp. LX-66]
MLYINNNDDAGCGAFDESLSGQIVGAVCNIGSIAELRAQGVAVGAMVVNSKGMFVNGGLSIGGDFDVGSNRIHALQAGNVATDAANVGQLSPVVDALGGGAKLDTSSGAVSGPAYALANGGTRTTVGGALSGLDGAVTANKDNITGLQSLIAQDALSETIHLGGTLGGSAVDLSSKSGGRTQTRQLTGLSEGALSSISTDAVTGAQLHATNQNVAGNRSDIGLLQNRIDNGLAGLVLQDAATRTVTVAAASDGGVVDFTGTDGVRVLSGVADGKADHDAATIAQLKAVGLVGPEGSLLAALMYDDLALGSATLGGTHGTVIRNLAAGTVALGSMEAVNGGQLYDLRVALGDQIGVLNGRVDTLNVKVDALHPVLAKDPVPGGRIEPAIAPGTAPGSTAVGNGAGATGSGSTAVGTDASATGTDSTALGSNSTASGNGAVAVGAHSVADRDNTVSVGSAGNERQIANVAAGTARTDAANWGQVQDTVREVQHWVRDRFRQASRLANAGTAAALAATNVPQAYAPDQSALGAGIGSFKGQSALAVGLSTITPGGRWVVKGSLSGNTQGDVGVGMGAAMVW